MTWPGYPGYYGYTPTLIGTHAICRNFFPPDYCAKKNIRVPPTEEACDDFEARYPYPWAPWSAYWPGYRPSEEEELSMIKRERNWLERRLEEVKQRLKELGEEE